MAARKSWIVLAVVAANTLLAMGAAAQELYGVVDVRAERIAGNVFEVDPVRLAAEAPVQANNAYVEGQSAIVIRRRYRSSAPPPYFAYNLETTADGAREVVLAMLEDFGIPLENIFIMAESVLTESEHADALATQVFRRTGRPVDFLTADEEANFVYEGVVPPNRRRDVVMVDISAAGVRASYAANTDGDNVEVRGFEVSAEGFASLLDDVVEANGGVPPQGLRGALTEAARRAMAPQVYQVGLNHPPLMTRSRVYLSGRTVTDMLLIVDYSQRGVPWTPITADTVNEFVARVREGRAFDRANFLIEGRPPEHDDDRRIRLLRDSYTDDQLLAVAEVMATLSTSLQFDRRDAVFFSQRSRAGARLSYLTQKILNQEA